VCLPWANTQVCPHNFEKIPQVIDGDTFHLEYGAADTRLALATGSGRAMLKWLEQYG